MVKIDNNSWRNVEQHARVTPAYWRALVMKILFVGVTLSFIIASTYFLFSKYLNLRSPQTLEFLEFTSNGMLNETWLRHYIDLPFGKNILSVPIESYCKQLEQIRQIESVVVRRVFPHTLQVDLREREALLRILVSVKGRLQVRCVAVDGVIFQPIQYDKITLKNLPRLTHVNPKQIKQGRLLGMSYVVDLCRNLNKKLPEIYQHVSQISLQHFDPLLEPVWVQIECVLQSGAMVVFSCENVDQQLDRLRLILQNMTQKQRHDLATIDLSLPNPVITFKSKKN